MTASRALACCCALKIVSGSATSGRSIRSFPRHGRLPDRQSDQHIENTDDCHRCDEEEEGGSFERVGQVPVRLDVAGG